MSKFPKCFPENFEKDILPKNAKYEEKEVYRIMKSGKIERNNFISTFEEMKYGLIPKRKRCNINDSQLYSTSCYEKYDDIQYTLNLFMRHHPKAVVAKGITAPECGPCQRTAERTGKSGETHVDWWIYEEANPQIYFEEVIDDE